MRPPKSLRDRQDQVKERIPPTRSTKHMATRNVAGKARRLSSSGSAEPSGSNLPPEPTPKEWKQVGETKDRLILSPPAQTHKRSVQAVCWSLRRPPLNQKPIVFRNIVASC